MSSFNHAIARISDSLETRKFFGHVEQHVRQERRGYGPNPDELVWRPGCSGHDCPFRPEFVTRYEYVTGRAGRVTDRIGYACQSHAQRFASLHGLQLPADVEAT